jgi:hypothetical protein
MGRTLLKAKQGTKPTGTYEERAVTHPSNTFGATANGQEDCKNNKIQRLPAARRPKYYQKEMTPWTHPPRSTRFLELPPILHRHADAHALNASLYCKYAASTFSLFTYC